jgi:pyruvate dehydrogenase E1 component beta subunit
MYGKTFEATDRIMDREFLVPFGKAKIERVGTDVTLSGFSKMVGMCLKAADALAQEGISCEVSYIINKIGFKFEIFKTH